MAKLKVKKGLEANLPAVEDGSLLITTDSKKLYLDNGEERIQVGGNSGGSAGGVTVDVAMSDTSVNPVQNKVIKAYVDSLIIDDGSID